MDIYIYIYEDRWTEIEIDIYIYLSYQDRWILDRERGVGREKQRQTDSLKNLITGERFYT